MALTIRFQSGPRAGQTLHFNDDVAVIAVGRDAARCQVVFEPHETAVGREHCALRRILGRYRLVTNDADAVIIDDQPATDDMEVWSGATLQLGDGGPKIVIETHDQRPGSAPTRRRLRERESTGDPRKTARVALYVALLSSLLMAIGMGILLKHAETTKQQLADMRRITDNLAGITSDNAQTIGGLIAKSDAFGESIRQLQPRLQQVLHDAAPSVYLVIKRDRRGADDGVATAWVVADGVLATNAHVAEEFDALRDGEKLIVRSAGEKPRDFIVERVRLHPGYEAFARLWSEYQPVIGTTPANSKAVETPGEGCDVALMYVANAIDLADPLPLAGDEQLMRLSPGDAVGFVGFPMEGVFGVNPAKPNPQVHVGHITAVTSYFGVNVIDEQGHHLGQLIQHALPASGGASGSPIFDVDGRVIAVLSGSNVIGMTDDMVRIGSPANINFAQRADLLRELLDGTVDQRQAERNRIWRERIRDYPSRNEIEMLAAINNNSRRSLPDWWLRQLQSGAGRQRKYTRQDVDAFDATMPPIEDGRSTLRHQVDLPHVGPTLVLAQAKGECELNMTVNATRYENTTQHDPANRNHTVIVAMFDAESDTSIECVVAGDTPGVPVTLSVFQVTSRPYTPDDILADFVQEWIEYHKLASAESIHESSPTLKTNDEGTGTFELELKLDAPGEYYAIAVAPDEEDIDMVVRLGDEELHEDVEYDHYPIGPFTLDEPATVSIVVFCQETDVAFNLHVYRGVKKAN